MNEQTGEGALGSWEQAVLEFRAEARNLQFARDAYYDDPLMGAAERYWRSTEWQAIRLWLPRQQGLRVLDIGAGRGIASYAFAKDGHDVTALEPDPSSIVGAQAIRQLAQDSGLRVHVLETTSERLPLEDGSCDVVFARAVMHHLPDLAAACREFHRVLRPGGRFIGIREHVISRDADLAAFHKIHPLHWRYGGEMAYRLPHYLGALTSAGFGRVQAIEPLKSDVNLFPYTRRTMLQAATSRVSPRAGGIWQRWPDGLVERLWSVLATLSPLVDHRPGRLYSFVADKG
jgi:SAM-dependent methyltransferase